MPPESSEWKRDSPAARRLSDFKRPAVFHLNRFGDQFIALPAMRALGALFPDGLQLLLGEGMASFLYRGVPFIGDPVRLRWDDYDKESIDCARVAHSAAPCDLFICLSTPYPFAKELACRLGASRTIGRSQIFDDHVVADNDSHAFDTLFAIPQYLDPSLRFDQFCSPPLLSAAAESAAERYLSAKCSFGKRLLFVHPETKPEKSWARESFVWIIKRFLAQRPEYTVIVSSLAPFEFGFHDSRLIWSNDHLELTIALLKRADLFLGVDSCFLHAADLFRIPGVALFGPTEPWQWGFRVVPSFRHVAEESMDKILPEPVLDALLALADQVERDSPE